MGNISIIAVLQRYKQCERQIIDVKYKGKLSVSRIVIAQK